MRNKKMMPLLTLGLVATFAVPAMAAEGDKAGKQVPTKKAEPNIAESIPMSEYRAEAERGSRDFLEKSKQHPAHSLPFQHYRPRLDVTLKVQDSVAKVRAEVVQIVDGMVLYVPEGAFDRAKVKNVAQLPKNAIKRATFAPGIEALASRKVGQTITLHLQNDPRGFAYVTNVTR